MDDKKTALRETRYTDESICFAKVRKSKNNFVYSAFIYDQAMDKAVAPESLVGEHPKYLNINSLNGKKYVYMDAELVFLGKMIDEIGFRDAMDYFKRQIPEEAFSEVFQNVIAPSVGGGATLNELARGNRKLLSVQAKIHRAEIAKKKAEREMGL